MLHLSGRSEEAIEKFQRAIELDGHFSPAYSNLGAVYKAQGNWDFAIENYRRAIDLNPKSAEAQNNLGRLLLLQQNFGEAFDLLEHRWNTQKIFGAPYDGTRPSWSGQETHRVLVWKEQGIGDEVMFGALIWDLWLQVAGVIVECDERLLGIYERSFPKEIRFVSSRTELSDTEYDSQIAIGSLPKFFRRSRDSFKKTRTQWLIANDQGVARFRHTIKSDKKLIGISWSTASQKNNAGARNIRLSELIDGIGQEDYTFVNLQYGDITEEIRQHNLSRGAEIIKQIPINLFTDVNQLADLVATCDVVVSIDNFTVHLAGALGIETHVLLPKLPDERWGLIDQKSCWYRSVHLHRQSSSGDWKSCLGTIQDHLSKNDQSSF